MSAKKVQGASRKPVKKSKQEQLKPVLLRLRLLSVVFVVMALVFGAGYLVTTSINNALNVAVESVEVKGKLRYESAEAIQQLMNEYLEKGYVQADLKQLQLALIERPWIKNALLKRKLSNVLEVDLEEQTVAALWNDEYLMNEQGELFKPEIIPVIRGLVRFEGKAHDEVIDLYQTLKSDLQGQSWVISSLVMKSDNYVLVEFDQQTTVAFMLDNLKTQTNNLKTVVKQGLQGDLYKASYIDLRYSNGVAVTLKEDKLAYMPTSLIGEK